MELIIHPNDILRTTCTDLIQAPDKKLLEEMWKLVKASKGIGLAAPQVGETINMFLINTTFEKKVFVNPKIIYYSQKMCEFEEGCLSIPGFYKTISRPEMVQVEYLDKNFIKRKEYFSGVNARVIQHEMNHLEGILILDF